MASGGGRRWLLPVVAAAAAVGGAVLVRGGDQPAGSPQSRQDPPASAQAPARSPADAAQDAPTDPPRPYAPPAEVDAALQAHARAARPRWTRAAEILQHSDQEHLGPLAAGLAARMAEAEAGLPADRRQELVVEERQLLNHLRARYVGFAPLMTDLDALDADLAALEGMGAEPVASPPPRRPDGAPPPG